MKPLGIALLSMAFAANAAGQLPLAGSEFHSSSDMTSNSGMMGAMLSPVAGQPYETRKVTRSVWKLADGTTITTENATRMARDGQGRVREEIEQTHSSSIGGKQENQTIQSITISDPVDHSIVILTPSPVKIAMRMQMPDFGGLAKKAAFPGGVMGIAGGPVPTAPKPIPAGVSLGTTDPALAGKIKGGPSLMVDDVRTEELGTDSISGVTVRGKRTTTTIPAGKIGNDRPIVITHEEWYSNDLKLVVKSEDNDPRTGKRTMVLEGLIAGEPEASLFKVPADYKVQDMADMMKTLGSLGHNGPDKH